MTNRSSKSTKVGDLWRYETAACILSRSVGLSGTRCAPVCGLSKGKFQSRLFGRSGRD